MRTQGEFEATICEGISRFEQEYMGRGPKDIERSADGARVPAGQTSPVSPMLMFQAGHPDEPTAVRGLTNRGLLGRPPAPFLRVGLLHPSSSRRSTSPGASDPRRSRDASLCKPVSTRRDVPRPTDLRGGRCGALFFDDRSPADAGHEHATGRFPSSLPELLRLRRSSRIRPDPSHPGMRPRVVRQTGRPRRPGRPSGTPPIVRAATGR